MENFSGELALAVFILVGISWIELRIQDSLCNSTRTYVASIIIIVWVNILITMMTLIALFGFVTGVSSAVVLAASMGFPLWEGINKIPQIKEKNNVLQSAKNMVDTYHDRGANG